ncbi:class I SAM-dependent methyltransferase [Trueperella bialowiezensis]|uniref:Tellurite resistance protein TehB n=1 Tax=Trueperella bialowiezensis TaxID=312285 RepID=A0A448PCF1_9ACTO|nr:class I SAM-dependent methyltransferase [Trueperella bialowiezensis]VEI12655.1 tellurite resistance protein TehB [Trueperella bialowiezensis]
MTNNHVPHRAAQFRNDMYHGTTHHWSGNPNQALIAEVEQLIESGVRPGTALDVGAGEGADAVWLAKHGWEVTAVEPSKTAVQRGQQLASDADVAVHWIAQVLEEAELGESQFDLVVSMYVAFLKEEQPSEDAAGASVNPARFLTELVAPGGHLLFVHHEGFDYPKAHGHRFTRDDYVDPDVLRATLRDGWRIITDAVRERHVDGGGGAHHHTDVVLLAQRI